MNIYEYAISTALERIDQADVGSVVGIEGKKPTIKEKSING
jgi:hypothetical protein